MSIFPTQYSTLSSAALGKYVEKQYGFNNLHCRLLLHNVSDTYQLEGPADKYILKIYRDAHRSLEEINGEVQLLNQYKKQGASVSAPIADEEGRFVQAFNAAEGTRHGVLFTYAAGQPVMAPNEQQIKITGIEMAKLHNIAATVELNYQRKEYNIDTLFTQPLQTLAPAFKNLPEEYEILKSLAVIVTDKLNSFDTSRFSYGYIQYDFLPKNFHFDEQDRLTFFDFDFAGKGWLAHDLMSYWAHYALNTYLGRGTREANDKDFTTFLTAYRSVRHLSAEEEAAIPYLNIGWWIFYLGFQYENFDDWSNFFFNERYLKDRVPSIKKLLTMYTEL
jgi:Ser/Thr protein kinase RdoA (MazF antagonist)